MRDMVTRIAMLIIAVSEIICGIVLLVPWFGVTVPYVYPRQAFALAIFFVGFGGFVLALATVGFHGTVKMKPGRALLKNKGLENIRTAQQADSGDAL